MNNIKAFDFTSKTNSDLILFFWKLLKENPNQNNLSIPIQNISRDILSSIICNYSSTYSCSLSPLKDENGNLLVNEDGTPLGYIANLTKRG